MALKHGEGGGERRVLATAPSRGSAATSARSPRFANFRVFQDFEGSTWGHQRPAEGEGVGLQRARGRRVVGRDMGSRRDGLVGVSLAGDKGGSVGSVGERCPAGWRARGWRRPKRLSVSATARLLERL
eukprot:COSAG02_NODE_758_length_17516_cov_53.301085_2_plen_128_part_00